jgi:methyl halide transferase
VPPRTDLEWDARYAEGTIPWDSGLASRELRRLLDETAIELGRALELGCGSGTNAVFLAERGFAVTAVDLSPRAIERAKRRAADAGVAIEFHVADATGWNAEVEPFDLVFDRGCYHCVRTLNLYGYLATLRRVTRPGTRAILLTGNADAPDTCGPPTVDLEEIGRELGPLFEVEQVRRFHFEDPGGVEGPLGWSILGRRRGVIA